MKPLSYVELSKDNLIHNAKLFKSLAGEKKVAFAIKGNAYGHGQNEVATIVEKYADYFLVNSLEELRLLRKVSKKKTFLFGYTNNIEEAMKLGCIFGVFSLSYLQSIQRIAKKLGVIQDVHIAVDALLGREGFLESEVEEVFKKKFSHVRITGMYAHFANIEDTHNFTHAQKQIEVFERVKREEIDTHISATSGVLKHTSTDTIVRVGIGLYGLWPSGYLSFENRKVKLKPVLSWKTHIAQVKILPKGRTIGYGLTYMTTKKTTVAVVPQGYADGLPRLHSNNGYMLVGGKKCSILGRVAMNMTVIDVSKVKDVQEGDEVVILGSQGKKTITAEDMAKESDTINYEVVTRISPLLPRMIK